MFLLKFRATDKYLNSHPFTSTPDRLNYRQRQIMLPAHKPITINYLTDCSHVSINYADVTM